MTARQRIVLILPWLTMGGADKFNLDLTAKLTEYGWVVSIITTLASSNPWYDQFRKYTSDLATLSVLGKEKDYPELLLAWIRQRQADLVLISNSELGYDLLPYLRYHLPQVTFIDYNHMEEEDWHDGGYPRRSCDAQAYLDLSLVASRHLKAWMVERGASPDRVEVAYINVDSDFWKPDRELRSQVRKQLGLSPEVPVILYAGRLCKQKQPEVFARVMEELDRSGSSFKALVAGSGEYEGWLKRFISEHRLVNDIAMVGAVLPERMRELMAASDIFFLPSLWEGIALTIYEAMACGLVVVGADVGGQRELVVDGTGFLIKPGTQAEQVKEYTAILSSIINGKEDYKEKIGYSARQRIITNFQLNGMGKRMVQLFAQARQWHDKRPRPIVTGEEALASYQLAMRKYVYHRGASWLPDRLKRMIKRLIGKLC